MLLPQTRDARCAFIYLTATNQRAHRVLESPENAGHSFLGSFESNESPYHAANNPANDVRVLKITLDQKAKSVQKSFAAFGSSPGSCDVVLDGRRVSPKHCHFSINLSPRALVLKDTSSYGTRFKAVKDGVESDWQTCPAGCGLILLHLDEAAPRVVALAIGPAEFRVAGVPRATDASKRQFQRNIQKYLVKTRQLAKPQPQPTAANTNPPAANERSGRDDKFPGVRIAPNLGPYDKAAELGRGTFGSVAKVTERQTGMVFAQKTIQIRDRANESQMVANEIFFLSELDHVSRSALFPSSR